MKYCSKCGKELNDETEYCPYCGAEQYAAVSRPSEETAQNESSTLGVLSIVFGALGGLLGLVLSIIGLSTYKNETNRTYCKIGLGLCCMWVFILVIVFAVK